MLFYRSAHTLRHEGQPATTRPSPTTPTTPTTDYPMRAPWMLKCLVVGTALLVLAYWLVQIAGAQYLATLTSATLLSFLLVYIVWCLTVKRRQTPQHTDSAAISEPPVLPTTSGALPAPSLHPALKHYGVPPRECSPPPSYDEVLRQMGAAAAAAAAAATAATGSTTSTRCDVEAPPIDAIDTETPSTSSLPMCTIESSEEPRSDVPNPHSQATSTSVHEATAIDTCLAAASTSEAVSSLDVTRELTAETASSSKVTAASEAAQASTSTSTAETQGVVVDIGQSVDDGSAGGTGSTTDVTIEIT